MRSAASREEAGQRRDGEKQEGHTRKGELTRELLQRLALLELAPPVLARALEPFPVPLRTLDALHLASIEFLRARRHLACHTRHRRKRTSPHGLSSRDTSILAHLDPGRPMISARLAEHLGVARSTMSEALKRLTQLGYVESEGPKSSGVRLTSLGTEAVQSGSVLEAERLHRLLSTLTPDERRSVAAGMRALAAGCERMARTTPTRGRRSPPVAELPR